MTEEKTNEQLDMILGNREIPPQSESVIHYNPETLTRLEQTTPDLITTKYVGASTLKLTDEEEKKLSVPVDLLDINVRPDGLIYYPQVFVRERLNDAFGRGQWSLIEHQVIKDEEHNKIYFEGSLYVRGCFVAKAIGEANYFPTNYKGEPNKMFSWASAHESAKSDCIVRCGKDLGIGKELWQPRFSRDFLKDFCIKVWRNKTGGYGEKVGTWQWRMNDAEPFFDEVVNQSEPKPKQEPQAKKPEQSKIVDAPLRTQPIANNLKETEEKSISEKICSCLNMVQLSNVWVKLNKKQKEEFESVKNEQKERIRTLSLSIPLTETSSIFEIEEKLNFIKTKAELNVFARANAEILDALNDDNVNKKFASLEKSLK